MGAYEQVKKLCDMRGIAVTQLEKELGFGRGSIGKMRKSKPSGERLQKIADYFGVPVSYFLYEEMHTSDRSVQISVPKEYYDELQTRLIAQKLKNNPELSVMFEALSDLAPEDAKLVMNMVERMKNGRGT